ncbi:hypothetical protein ACLOJK_025252 [Asimina triloba]
MARKYEELKEAIERVELVDAHAHNLVDLDSSFPFLRCFSEAEGDALAFAPHSLSFKVNSIYKVAFMTVGSLIRNYAKGSDLFCDSYLLARLRSLRDIASLYGCEATLEAIESHRRSSGLHSIVSKCFDASKLSSILIDDGIEFDKMHDIEWHKSFGPAVGRVLRIERLAENIIDQELPGASNYWTLDMFTEIFMTKLKSYPLSSSISLPVGFLVGHMCTLADKVVALKSIAAYRSGLEIDTHVSKKDAEEGLFQELRDKDLDLRYSNPLHLRVLLEDSRFSKCQIVLLHASYPFSKEASYLASVYPQVYLDFGLAVPKLSVHGMISSVKELLELAPIKKVMFSSDGYAFPETYYLGAKRAREIVLAVLSDACDNGDLTTLEAVEAIEDIFKRNADCLYKMNRISDRSVKKINSHIMESTTKSKPEDIVFVRILWVDGSGQHRCRVVPAERFYKVVKHDGVGLTFASMGMSSFCDGPAEGTDLTAVGEIRLIPDLSTKQRLPWYYEVNAALEAMDIHIDQLHAESGKGQFEIALGYTECTRAADKLVYAREAIRSVARKHKLLATFVPKYFMTSYDGFGIIGKYLLFTSTQYTMFHWVHIIAKSICFVTMSIYLRYALDDIGSGSHVHSSLWENGKNIFMAADGSKTRYGMSSIGEEFMAGVLHHLPSIFAFTAPLPNSYDRIQPNTWSGAYLCWGRENREAPLRTACPPGISNELVSNFEIKSFDGCANPYLGLASIMAAGLDGLRRKLKLPEPVETNPSLHADKLQRLPKDLSESVQVLEKDEFMKDLIGGKLVTAIIGIRKYSRVSAYTGRNKNLYGICSKDAIKILNVSFKVCLQLILSHKMEKAQTILPLLYNPR